MANREFAKLYSMYFFYTASHIFGWTLSTLYFLQSGYSAAEVALFSALCFIVSAAFVATAKGVRGASSMQAGLLMKMSMFIMALGIAVKPVFFFIGAVFGIMTICFWLPFNIRFFNHGAEGKNAAHSGSYFLIWPLLNALVPVLSGMAAASYGMKAVLLGGAALLVPAVLITRRINYKDFIKFGFRKFIANTKGVKTITLIQGIWEGTSWVVVPIATYGFITSEVKYGAFFSYLGIFGLVAFLAMARLSDRIKKRAVFLCPVAAALAISTMLSAGAPGLAEWMLYQGIASFFSSIFAPFAITVLVDVSRNMADTMISREYFINIGRAIGAFVSAGMAFFFGDIKIALLFSGAALLLYPAFLLAKRKYYKVEI